MRPAAPLPALTAAVVALAAGGCGGDSDEQQVRDIAKDLSRALAAGDYGRACELFSLEARAQVEAAVADDARDCATALRQLADATSSGTPSGREIDAAKLTRSGDRATLTYQAGTREPQAFAKHRDRWLVAGDSPASGQRNYAPCWRRAGAAIATTSSDLRFAADFVKRTEAAGGVPAGGGDSSTGGGVNYIYADGWVIFYQYGIDEPTNSEVVSDPSRAIAVAYVRDPRRVQSVVARASDC
ncbi:MAG: hypothetical protein ACR2H2_05240 [Solirubrobacteraceae bacterium]